MAFGLFILLQSGFGSGASPGNGFVGAERYEFGAGFAERHARRWCPRFTAQRDSAGVARQSVEVRAETACEAVEPVECVHCIERFRVQFQRGMGGETARATASGFLGVYRVRRTVGA